MKVLVLACHADDEILGAGGVISKHIAEGDEVYICVVTSPLETKLSNDFKWDNEFRENKLREQKAVDEFLGIKERYFLNHSVLELNEKGSPMFNYSIQKIIDKINPHIIYTHYCGDLNYQHQLVGLATIIGVRPPKKITLYMYETESTLFSETSKFLPNYHIDITNYIDKKCQAFELYKSEYRTDIHPRNSRGLRIIAQFRGLKVGLEYAEAFILVKKVIE